MYGNFQNQNNQGKDNFYCNAWFMPPSLERSVKKSFSRIWLSIFLYICASYLVSFLIQILIIVFQGSPQGALSILEIPIVSASLGVLPMYLIGLPILALVLRGMDTRKRKPINISAKEFLSLFLVSVSLMQFGSYISQLLSGAYSSIFGYEIQNSTSDTIEAWPIWLVFLLVVIIGPLVEEFIFRRLLIDRLSVFGDKTAILISSVAFALHHGNLFQFFSAALLGLVLGYIYVKTNKLFFPVLMHAILNFLGSIVPMTVMKFMDELTLLQEALLNGAAIDMGRYYLCLFITLGYSLVMLSLVIVGAVILFRNYRKVKIDPYCEIDIPRGRTLSLATLNPGFIFFTVEMLAIFVLSLLPV